MIAMEKYKIHGTICFTIDDKKYFPTEPKLGMGKLWHLCNNLYDMS